MPNGNTYVQVVDKSSSNNKVAKSFGSLRTNPLHWRKEAKPQIA